MANKLMFEVGLDGAGFERGISRLATGGIAGLKGLALQAFGVYSVAEAMHKTVEAADELVTTSRSLDTTVEQLQILRQAAKDNLVEFSSLANALSKIDVLRDKALSGDAKAMGTFARLGVTEAMLRSMTAAQIFTGPLAGTARKTNEADIAGPLREIFGRSFRELIPVLRTDFDELGGHMKNLGALMDTEAAAKLHVLSDEAGLLAQILTAQLAPGMVMVAQMLMELGTKGAGLMSRYYATLGDLIGQATQLTFKDWMRKGISLLGGGLGSFGPMARKFAELDKKPFDFFSANEAGKMAQKPMDDLLQEMLAKLSEAAKKLNESPAPSFGGESGSGAGRGLPHEKDALVRVGNFLGTAKGQVEAVAIEHVRLARIQTKHLADISNNTKRPTEPGAIHFAIH